MQCILELNLEKHIPNSGYLVFISYRAGRQYSQVIPSLIKNVGLLAE